MKTFDDLYKQLEQTIIDQKGQYDQDTYEGVKIGLELAIAIIEQDGYIDADEKVEKMKQELYAMRWNLDAQAGLIQG
jgi:hypothetical protein